MSRIRIMVKKALKRIGGSMMLMRTPQKLPTRTSGIITITIP